MRFVLLLQTLLNTSQLISALHPWLLGWILPPRQKEEATGDEVSGKRGDEVAQYPFPTSITRRTRCTPYTLPPSCYRCCLILVFFSSLILQQSR